MDDVVDGEGAEDHEENVSRLTPFSPPCLLRRELTQVLVRVGL